MDTNEITEQIIGAYYDVYNGLGYGFLESVYESAFVYELKDRGLITQRQHPVSVYYRGVEISTFRLDLMVAGSVIVEIKSCSKWDKSFEAQLLNYLKATDLEIGLVFNFGEKPEFKRMIFDNPRKHRR